jgi:hypothetical protein
MLGTRFASSEKVSKFDLRHRSARGHVGSVQDGDAVVVVTTEKPFVAILAVVNLALVIGHFASAGTTNGDPHSFRPKAGPCHLPNLRTRFPRWLVSDSRQKRTSGAPGVSAAAHGAEQKDRPKAAFRSHEGCDYAAFSAILFRASVCHEANVSKAKDHHRPARGQRQRRGQTVNVLSLPNRPIKADQSDYDGK